MKIEVTQVDIDNGMRREGYRCPVALALDRSLNYPDYLYVGMRYVNLNKSPTIWLPGEAADFIKNFDEGRTVAPFTFDLPDEK